jgi:hypothetical protein
MNKWYFIKFIECFIVNKDIVMKFILCLNMLFIIKRTLNIDTPFENIMHIGKSS